MRKAVDKLMNAISLLLGILLMIAVILVLVQVIFRYLLKSPLGWTNQMCQFLFVWIVMLGLPVLFHTKSVATFDSLSSKLSPRAQTFLHVIICLLSLFFAVCFIIFSWQFMMKKGGMMIPAFRVIPYYTVYASMPVCGVLTFVEMALQLTESVKELFQRKEAK